MKKFIALFVAAGFFAVLYLAAQDTNPPKTKTNIQLERDVYSFLITDDHVPAVFPNISNCFAVAVAAQNRAAAAEIKRKFGTPAAVETNVGFHVTAKGEFVPSWYNGNVWFFGRVGVLIQDDKAVVVLRSAPLRGTNKNDLVKVMREVLSIGVSSNEQAMIEKKFKNQD